MLRFMAICSILVSKKAMNAKASHTVPPWFSCALSLFSSSFPSLSVAEASCCPGLHEHTAQGNPDKQHAATSEGLAESSCPTSVAGPLRLNTAPESEKDTGLILSACISTTNKRFMIVQSASVNFRNNTYNMAKRATLVDQLLQ